MTLRSRRKHPITAPTTRRPRRTPDLPEGPISSWGVALALLAVTLPTLSSSPLAAAESARRPARLSFPQDARPLPPRVSQDEQFDEQFDERYDEQIEERFERQFDERHDARFQRSDARTSSTARTRGARAGWELEEHEEHSAPAPIVARQASARQASARQASAQAASAQRVEAPRGGRSRPAVVQLTILDDSPTARDHSVMSARHDHRGSTTRHASSPNGSVNRVGYQDRSWTSRSGSPGEYSGEVRRVQGTTSHFDDPFGDRQPAPRPMTLAPARSSYPVQDAGAPRAPSRSQPAGATFHQESSSDCDRIYNDRNCCDDEVVCRQGRQRLLRSPISKISLDISPRFNPTSAETGRLPDRERSFEDELRIWRDRDGGRIAEGSLIGIENGRVLIRRENGSIARVPVRRLSDDDICYFAAWWGVPNICVMGDEQYADRHFAPLTMSWKASALCHKPLYFEEVQLERYGHTTGPFIQPALSGAHFFLNVAALPYRAGINPPNECLYSLGYYRPGSCAPWMVPPIPLSVRGALLQAGTVVGGAALIP